jgi:hypothetical protein
LLIQGEKSDERWKALLSKQEKIVIEKERVAVKKQNDDFMILTADTLRMDGEVKDAHMFYHDMILQEIVVRKEAEACVCDIDINIGHHTCDCNDDNNFNTGRHANIMVMDQAEPPSTSGTNPFF